MANSISVIKSSGVLAKLAAGTLVDNLKFCKTIDKAEASDYNGKNGYSAGDTIYINLPARFIPNSSYDATSSMLDFVELKQSLALDIISSVPIELSSQELASTINLGSVYERAVKPAVQAIAQDVEKTCLDRAVKATYNIVGTAGTVNADTATMLSANQKMSEFLAPEDERYALLSPAATTSAVNSRKGFVNDPAKVSKQYVKGYMGDADGMSYLTNNLLPTITSGTATGSHTVTTTVSTQGQATLAITGTGSQTLKAGQTFTVAGVNAVHPQTKVDLGYLQQFVITADATASSGAYASVAVSPAMYTTGSLQNITAFPTSSSVITLGAGVGNTASTAYRQNLTYQKGAFRMVSVPLVMPEAVELAAQETYEGVSVAIVRGFDVIKRRMITRVDFLGGFCAPRPEWACRATN